MPEPTQTAKKNDVQFQTYSNREYINYVYSVKYEDCVHSLVEAITDEKMGELDRAPATFRKHLSEIYWLVIVPRKAALPADSKLVKYVDNLLDYSLLTLGEGSNILAEIAAYLYEFGTLRPESRVPDPKKAFLKRMEQRRPHHGTL